MLTKPLTASIIQVDNNLVVKSNEKEMKLKKSALIEKLVVEMDTFIEEEASHKVKTEIARDTVNLFFDSIKEALRDGDRIEIRGFGSFVVKDYDGYTGRNPKTGVKVEVKPKKLPAFRPGRQLKALVDQKN